MTYVELLVALSLLCIIMVAFTPMLLKSYETLYGAGEMNEATYEGKQEIEEGLATRVVNNVKSLDVALSTVDLSDNVNALVSGFELGLRNITSTTQFSLETLFYGGRGRLNVLSSSVMRDDYDAKEVVIQAEGVNINEIIKANGKTALDKENIGSAAIRVYLPQYDANHTSEAEGFNEDKYVADANLYVTKSADGAAYTLTITGVDITTPVLKIVLWYVDENNKIQELSNIVRIEPATITIAGGTSGSAGATGSIAYYTTAGVETTKVVDGYTTDFKVEARKMTGGTYATGTTFLNIQWVSEDTHADLDPYYVLTGSNGTIQRLFISNSNPVTYKAISGQDDVVGFPYTADGLTKYTYVTKWGGDKSHQFAFGTAIGRNDDEKGTTHQAAYSRGSWLTSSGTDSDGFPSYIGAAGVYGVQAKMAFYFNGFRMRTDGDERMRDGRRISYVILEAGNPIRFIGAREANNSSTSWGGFITPWEGPWNGGNGTEFHWGNVTDEYKFSASSPKVLLWNRNKNNELNYDEALAYLNLKAYSNLSPQKVTIASTSELGADSSVTNYLSDSNATNIRITSSYYNPVANEMRYLGSSVAYAYVQQVDNTGMLYEDGDLVTGRSNAAQKYQYISTLFSGDSYRPVGSVTGYLVSGSISNGTTIYKYSTGRNDPSYEVAAPALYNYASATYASTYSGQSAEFYVARRANAYTKTVDTDLEFTLGYSSNREEVFANVTYGTDKTEYQASYERFFNHSHYTLSNPSQYIGSLGLFETFTTNAAYKNTKFGAHYHVWFPGEFYNLTHTATKEGVTVAVGYTVSGSTYQWVDPDLSGNTSTALGSIYNDGVLAAVVNTGSADASFKNLLYYKDYETCATNNILSGKTGQVSNYGSFSNYINYYGETYGTHARQSIRFQAVDIATLESQSADGSYAKHYMAFFGDNRGRLFYAHVASAVGTGFDSETGEVDNANIALVTGIKDVGVEVFGDSTGYSQQLEIPTGDKFSEITSIYCQDRVVIVCGTEKDGKGTGVLFVRLNDGAGVERAEYFEIKSSGNYVINDTLVLNGYLYLAGQKNNNKGFVMAAQYSHIELYMNGTDEERALDKASPTGDSPNGIPDAWENVSESLKKAVECELNTVAYSIAGHA